MDISKQTLLDRVFNLKANGTTVRTELMAGLTTFLTMCYIVIVNPLILGETGMDMGAVFVATCIASAIGCFVMGFIGNYPIALAPGMGLNAYFTFAVVKGMGVPWQVALGAVFISGLIFILFSFFKRRGYYRCQSGNLGRFGRYSSTVCVVGTVRFCYGGCFGILPHSRCNHHYHLDHYRYRQPDGFE